MIVVSDYMATGEGRTVSLLFLTTDDEKLAKKRFEEIFGYYMASGAEVLTIEESRLRYPQLTPDFLTEDMHNSEYYTRFHFNLS